LAHFAALVARQRTRWSGADVDLADVEDIEDVTEVIKDSIEEDADPALLFVEENDEWFAIVRVDNLGDARVFISDVRAVVTSDLAAVLFQDQIPEPELDEIESELDDDEDDGSSAAAEESTSLRPGAEPEGATDILVDLGVGPAQLLELCAEEGMLPADVIAALCELIGCADAVEVYR
jgi:putative tRNA adenosine deaminase-associated protein